MDSRKLTAVEDSEVVRSRMVCCDNDCEHLKIEEHGYTWFCEKYGNVSLDRTVAGYEEVEYEAFRCSACLISSFSMLTPPPDAAVREAVESLQRMIDIDTFVVGTDEKMRTLLRAVQAPRLTKSQAGELRFAVEVLQRYGSPAATSASVSLMTSWPEAFAGEVGNE